jgi:hypothetical protein
MSASGRIGTDRFRPNLAIRHHRRIVFKVDIAAGHAALLSVRYIGRNKETPQNETPLRSKLYTRKNLSGILELSGRFCPLITCYAFRIEKRHSPELDE